MSKIIYLLVLIIIIPFTLAATIECFDDGSIKIKDMEKKVLVYAKSWSGDYFEVPGEYFKSKAVKETQYYNFISEEALLVNENTAQYSVKFGKTRTYVNCPPFRFSCRIFNITVDYCYNRDGLFTAKFMAHNFHFDETNVLRFTKPYLLRYEIKTEDNKDYVHAPKVVSSEFKNINITTRELNSGNKFLFKWPTEQKVKKFYIRYDKCSQKKYNFYKSAECTEATTCTINSDCFEDEFCENWTCKELECGECQYIEERLCVDYECCSDEVCPLDERCENHACVNYNCNDNEIPFDHICKELTCQENEIAVNHSCQELNCAKEEAAVNHTCVKLECQGNEVIREHACENLQCAEDEVAENHVCNKLSCGTLQKAYNHRCTNYIVYFFKRLFS